jgi:predicted nucleic acid-binding protein
MKCCTAKADFFDASALAKIYSDEPGSAVVREYFRSRATKYTTPFCFYEAMNVLKGKWKHKGQYTLEQYLDAAFHLTAWYGASSSKVKDLNFTEPTTFAQAKAIAQRSQLDLSDAFQILSVKKATFPCS